MSLRAFVVSAAVASGLLVAADASAAFHIMKISEVIAGPGSYVELEMLADGQNATNLHVLTVYDPSENVLDSVTLTNVTKGVKNAHILIGTAQTEATFGVKPDFATMKTLPSAGGKVCFDASNVDCFSWGTYPTKATLSGAPFAALSTTKAAKRKPGVDTDSSLNDFVEATPGPQNNAAAPGEPDAGSSTSSSSSSSSGTASSTASSGGSSTSGNPSSSTSSGASGVTTNPSSSSSSSSSGAAPAAAPAEDDGCNTTGSSSALTAVPLLAVVALLIAKRRARERATRAKRE